MDGQCLNRFIQWIDDAIENDEILFSEDIDWFLGDIPKEQWLLVGFSICAFTKSILASKGENYPVAVAFSLATTKHSGKSPECLTSKLFKKVTRTPTIYIHKGHNFIPDETSSLSRFEIINKQSLNLPINGDLFYCEKNDVESGNKYIDRFILFLQ